MEKKKTRKPKTYKQLSKMIEKKLLYTLGGHEYYSLVLCLLADSIYKTLADAGTDYLRLRKFKVVINDYFSQEFDFEEEMEKRRQKQQAQAGATKESC